MMNPEWKVCLWESDTVQRQHVWRETFRQKSAAAMSFEGGEGDKSLLREVLWGNCCMDVNHIADDCYS